MDNVKNQDSVSWELLLLWRNNFAVLVGIGAVRVRLVGIICEFLPSGPVCLAFLGLFIIKRLIYDSLQITITDV